MTNLSTACTFANQEPQLGDDRNNLAVSTTGVLSNGDNGAVRANAADVMGSVQVREIQDGAVYDVTSGQSFLLGDGTGPVAFGTGIRNVDRLFRRTGFQGSFFSGSPLMLSRAIPLNTSASSTTQGIYSGAGRVVIHTDRVYEIVTATGAVVDRGALPQPPRQGAETFATTGIAEHSGTTLFLTYIQSNTTISRMRITDGLVTAVATLTNMGDAGHLAVATSGSRWLTRIEGASQFGVIGEALVSCPVTITNNATAFLLSGYTTNLAGCTAVDTNALAGDDRGPIAVSGNQVWLTGDSGTVRFTVTNPVAASPQTLVGRLGDHMVSNIRSGQIFGLYAGTLPLHSFSGARVIDRIIPLNENTLIPSGAAVTLSRTISVDTNASSTNMLFHGWDRAVIVTAGRVWNINLTNGDVRDFGAVIFPAHTISEGWASTGIVETVGTNSNLLFVENSTRIARLSLTGALSAAATFTNLGDAHAINFLPALNRWFFKSEGTTQFTGATFAEWTLSCTGAFTN